MSSLPKFAIITGGNSGLGLHLAKALYSAGGFSIVLACRNAQKAENALQEIRAMKISQQAQNRPRSVQYILLDLIQRETFDNFFRTFTEICQPGSLCLLVNNAGIMNHSFQLTSNGVEIHFDSNYLGHYLLTRRLIPLMASKGRILNITSGYYEKCSGILSAEELTTENPTHKRNPNEYYAVSKLANLLHTLAINKHIQEKNLDWKIVAIRPGFIRETELGRETNWILRWLAVPIIYLFSKDLDYGISTMLHCINCDYDDLASGQLYEDGGKIATVSKPELVNIESADSLMKLSEQLTKTSEEN